MEARTERSWRRTGGRLEPWLVGVLAGYYLAKLLYLATRIARGLPPDEATHVALFPVLVPAYLFGARSLVGRLRPALRTAVAVAVAVGGFFVAGELPYFLRHAGETWFDGAPAVSTALDPRRGS